jgi:hypothetical protein
VDLEHGKAVVAAVPGVVRVRQVFPEEVDDEELLRMFVLDVEPAERERTLAALRTSKLVEEVEPAPTRRIRPNPGRRSSKHHGR